MAETTEPVKPETTPAKAPEPAAEPLKATLDKLADEVSATPASGGTVTLDFGKAGKLTGCLIVSNTSAHADGEQTVLVPFGGGYVNIHGIPAAAIVK